MRPRNTDWRYSAQVLPSLGKFAPNLKVCVQNNLLAEAEVNLRYCGNVARSRGLRFMPSKFTYSLTQDTPVYPRDLKRAKADCILAYERYPNKSHGLPVYWITSPSYLDVMFMYGRDHDFHERELAWKRERAERSERLIFHTEVARRDFIAQHGEQFEAKSVVIPYLFPRLTAAADISAKWEKSDEVRLLFVGREAIHKGLPATLKAALPLLEQYPNVSMTVVSRLADGPVEMPKHPRLRVMGETSWLDVVKLMRDSHVLVVPSAWESYGFVYVEAMSQGCVPLALNNPIQRELIGDNGILVSGQNPEEIREALRLVVVRRDRFYQAAKSGLQNFNAKHDPRQVGLLFQQTLGEKYLRLGEHHEGAPSLRANVLRGV